MEHEATSEQRLTCLIGPAAGPGADADEGEEEDDEEPADLDGHRRFTAAYLFDGHNHAIT